MCTGPRRLPPTALMITGAETRVLGVAATDRAWLALVSQPIFLGPIAQMPQTASGAHVISLGCLIVFRHA